MTAAVALAGAPRTAAAAPPPGNAAQQWDQIAEDTVVGSGAFQGEGFVYMAYVAQAMNGAVNPGERNGQSADAAVTEAAYRVLVHHFPAREPDLTALHDAALGAIPGGPAKRNGIMRGELAATKVLRERAGDGVQTPIASTSPFPTLPPGPGVWRLTPSAYAPPQTPWMANVRPFLLRSGDQFQPAPPPSLSSPQWVAAFTETKSLGSATSATRTDAQRQTALFWTANVIRQYNGLARATATRLSLDVPHTARLLAMINQVGADAMIAMMNAKYHFLFWRPVTAIDPTSVSTDGFGPTPGFDDGNPATAEQPGWRPLVTTPNHPEYPSAHATISSAIAEVLVRFLGTEAIDVDVQGQPGLDETRHFATADDLRAEVSNARIWAGLHYRFSVQAGTALGREVADYDLRHGFCRHG
ncbi:vanadium-dependent haloperoxidase [Solirubrobacter soli]|uniref:vanadium-dependent haloperoxidase n=1 Tax=Solirubrobacter soli TaxID=363832 RepID=UPI0003FAD6F5|nr:vanadium-dependent haloperoxidase [Solirubrobacter soli]